jgi:hypothetical protein
MAQDLRFRRRDDELGIRYRFWSTSDRDPEDTRYPLDLVHRLSDGDTDPFGKLSIIPVPTPRHGVQPGD